VNNPTSIAAALEASGPIDVLVNNAGIGVAFELEPFNVIVKLVVPGYGPMTSFFEEWNAADGRACA
jgi:short-subunit dehydrogenase